MFKDMQKWTEIRRRVLNQEISKRQACQEYGLGWRTLRRILEHEEPPRYRQKKPRRKPKLERFLPIIHEILEADKQAPKKQRHTAQRIFDRLVLEHEYDGGLTIVKDAVRAWGQRQAEVFVPLIHRPGEAQVDFGEAKIFLRGNQIKVAFFVMTLPYSDAIFCQVFPKECTEVFQEGHKRAFAFFGGVPRRISYDNSKIAVAKITGGRGREATREFLRLESHYLFEHHFCRVRRPNEKGHVENLLGFARRNYLVPLPEVDSLETLNEELIRRLRKDLKRKLRGKSGTKEELLTEEQPFLLPIPEQEFEARRVDTAKASSLSLVRFDGNDYSVPTAYAHQLAKLDLLILDELGYVPTSKLGAELLFDVISTAYERTSLIVTTNLPFENWTEVLGSERLTGATLDRLTHRCHILEATGQSYRLQDARRR